MAPRTYRTGLVLCIALWLLPAAPGSAQPRNVVVFDFELIDTSLEGEMSGKRADEQQRLVLISKQLRRLLSESGRYTVVDHAPALEQIAAAGYLYGCNGCEADYLR